MIISIAKSIRNWASNRTKKNNNCHEIDVLLFLGCLSINVTPLKFNQLQVLVFEREYVVCACAYE